MILDSGPAGRRDPALARLRPGGWYGEELVPRLRQPGRMAVIGSGKNLWDVVHVEDVASAILLAISEPAADGRVYHVADDEPITFYDFMALTASELGVGPPRRIPAPLARLVAGRNAVDAVVRSARSSNARIKQRAWMGAALPDRARGRAGLRRAPGRRLGGVLEGRGGAAGCRARCGILGAMSQNLDLVRSIFAEWGRGDFRSTDWADRDFELVIADGPAPGRWTGRSGMAEAWRDLLGAWEGLRSEAESYLELDEETVLVLAHFSGRGRSSGLDLAQVSDKGGAGVFHLRNGKVTKHIVYLGRERALADLGLAEIA